MKKRLIFLLVGISLLFSCQNYQEDGLPETSPADHVQISSLEDKDSSFVDETLAKQVAIKQALPMTRSALEIDEVITLFNAQGEPVIYVVNYKDDAGYIMVSATQNYHPILMQADAGKFSLSSSLPEMAEWYIETYKANIDHLRNAPYDSVATYRQEWGSYTEQGTVVTAESFSSLPVDVQRYVQDRYDEWISKGYEVSPISENGLNLPENLYTQALAFAEMSLREDYMETSFIVKMRNVESKKVGSMLTTAWGQDGVFNNAVYDYFGVAYPTGCVATAMAQIMNYHRKPTTYNWDAMDAPTYGVASLMLDIGLAADMNYSLDGSGTSDKNAVTVFKNFGYGNAQLISHDQFSVRSELLLQRPVYMSGTRKKNDGSKIGHAWVCDGVDDYYLYDIYCVMFLKYDELSYLSQELKRENEYGYRRFHMNWGYEEKGNGWFTDDNIKFTLPGETEERNYNINRQEIINIY